MWNRLKMCKNTRNEEHYPQILQSLSKLSPRVTMQRLLKSDSWNKQQVDGILSRQQIPITNIFLNKELSTGKERLQFHLTY